MLININYIIFLIIIAFILNYILIKFAFKYNFLDYPSARKSHLNPTPYTGGVVLIIFFIYFSTSFQNNYLFQIILFSSSIAGLLGLIDDKINLNPIIKIIFLILITIFVIYEDIKIITLGNYNIVGNLYLGNFSVIFNLLAILFLTNAFNYNDGIDGLTISTFWTSSALLLIISNVYEVNNLLININIILLISLLFNLSIFKLPKVFLGDTGSLLLGFFFSLIMIYLNRYHNVNAILIAWTVAYLVYEFLSTNIYRLIKKKKLTKPGQDHMHYVLLTISKSKIKTLILINSISITFFMLGYLSFKFNQFISLILFGILFLPYFYLRILLFNKVQKKSTNF